MAPPPANNKWVFIAAAIVAAVALLGWVLMQSGNSGSSDSARPIASVEEKAAVDWTNYKDEFISGEVSLMTTGKANSRTYPSPENTTISTTYPKGTPLNGRWVKGRSDGAKWLKLSNSGSYVWEGNLAEASAIAAAQPVNFAAYDGKYPFDKVGSTSFIGDPKVRSMALASVNDRSIIREIEARPGPMSPIKVKGEQLLASGCEQHNCDGFNWSYLVMQGKLNQSMRICYHDWEIMGEFSDWYESGRLKARKPGGCPFEL